jgi:hypothetical protein
MARAGAVHGVLLEFSPADKTALTVTVLAPPAEAGGFMHTLSLSRSTGLWKRLEADAAHVAGDYDQADDADLTFSFRAPLATDPVQADLKGAEAQASEPLKVLVARAQAVARGDVAGALALSARTSTMRDVPPEAIKQAAHDGAEMAKAYRAVKRVVIRRDTAVAILGPHSWASLVREDGAWKVAD